VVGLAAGGPLSGEVLESWVLEDWRERWLWAGLTRVAVRVVGALASGEGRLLAPGQACVRLSLRQASRRRMPSSTCTMSHFACAKYSWSAWQAQPGVSRQCSSW